MRKLKRAIRSLIYKYIKPPIVKVKNSNAQAGEDAILRFLFNSLKIKEVSYIDIGANDPIVCNNTYAFRGKHSGQILVEPDPSFFERTASVRPEATIVKAAIGVNAGAADFYIFNEPTLNTLSPEEASLRRETGKYLLKSVQKIPIVTIGNIIDRELNGALPLLISLDVEGIDYAVLEAFDFQRYQVPVWVVETCGYSENHIKAKNMDLIHLMEQRGFFVYADTYINTIFVNRDWFYNYRCES